VSIIASFRMQDDTGMTADPTTEQLKRPATDGISDTSARAPHDRRRPQRLDYVSPELIELLRGRPNAEALRRTERPAEYAFGAAQGICVSAVAGALCWAGIIGLVETLIG
jgi:hypothetical protein